MTWTLVTPASTSYTLLYSWQASYVAFGYVDDNYVDSTGSWAATTAPSDSWTAQSSASDVWTAVTPASGTWA